MATARPPASATKPQPPAARPVADRHPTALDALTDRFGRDLAAVIGAQDALSSRIGIAVSGGPDSMALLWLAHQNLAGRVLAATVDHGLRAGSAEEALMVAHWCAAQPISHTILRPPEPITGSLQAAARTVRYALLEQWRATQQVDWVLTAHHADDQAETLVMRLNRGAGVGGLAGIRPVQGWVARPLLHWRRDDLLAVTQLAALPHVQDPSNLDARFDRIRVRQQLQRGSPSLDIAAVSRSANHLADADAALDWAAQREIARWPDAGDPAVLWLGYPVELLRRILRIRLAAHPGFRPLKGVELDRLIAAIGRGQRASTGLLVLEPDRREPGRWTIRPASPARPKPAQSSAVQDKRGNGGC